MKILQHLTVMAWIFCTGICFSQRLKDRIGGTFITTQEMPSISATTQKGLVNSTDSTSIRKKIYFEITEITDDCIAILKVNKYKKGQTKDVNDFQKVKLKDLIKSSEEAMIKNGFIAGPLVLPVKLRPGYGNREFEFSKDVSFTGAAGYRFRLSNKDPFFFEPVIAIGGTSVSLDSINTQGKSNKNEDIFAFSICTGILFEFNKVQVGLFTGIDLISQNSKYGWVNQGMPWFSIGIGYQLFNVSNTDPKNNIKNK